MKFVYSFKEGSKDLKNLLGGKGANLSEMMRLGLPIPDGFTITTEACANYYDEGKSISAAMQSEIDEQLATLEASTGKKLGCTTSPLLVSVRSGARISMPGMMDTVLNLGLNNDTVEAMAKLTSNERFAYDSFRRFIQMFGDVVAGVERHKFEVKLKALKADKGYEFDLDLTVEDLKVLVGQFKEVYKSETGTEFPTDAKKQLEMAITAVFNSWDNERAVVYRKLNSIPDDIFTAVNIQSMVFGNTGDLSGTGVLFTRDPSTGERYIFGEYLMNAQGEDVVAGIRTPKKLSALKDDMPSVYNELIEIVNNLETHYKDMQDVEFTIENKKLYLLQTRTGKRSARAMVKIAVDMVGEALINKRTALLRIDPEAVNNLLFPMFTEAAETATTLTIGLGASPGAVSGNVYFSQETLDDAVANGEDTIFVREETSPEDIHGMITSLATVTSTGGATSHAAVVARGMGKPCVVGCKEIVFSEDGKSMKINGETYPEGTLVSVDGTSGKIFPGKLETKKAELTDEFRTLLDWSWEMKKMGVYANADNAADAQVAKDFGAVGIGLCRTEHMFFEEDRIPVVREMLVAETKEDRVAALDKLYHFQREDFVKLLRVGFTHGITVRLLDAPLHEFLPKTEAEMMPIAKATGRDIKELKHKIESMHETNPMLGHRGVRVAISWPEIYNMQARALVSAAIQVSKEVGKDVEPRIMIPLVTGMSEFQLVKKNIKAELDKVEAAEGKSDYKIGVMVEVPRAAILSNELATEADFLSYGTNDLTQMTLGFSRDDSSGFIEDYMNNKLFEKSPFASIDQRGVGKLVEISSSFGKMANPEIKTGICGEHGGDPESIEFFNKIGIDYVSCSPFRVPIAILSSAIANQKN